MQVSIRFDHVSVNGREVRLPKNRTMMLADFLRDTLGFTGTKVGCGTGDCGACTVIENGAAVYACIAPVGRVAGRALVTVEGLTDCTVNGAILQQAMLAHQAIQCGFCIPGMLCAATAALDRREVSDEPSARESVAGVLCRCTGYSKLVKAIVQVGRGDVPPPLQSPAPHKAVGTSVTRLDGREKVRGTERFGADEIPADALMMKAVRSPYHHARFVIGNVGAFLARHPGIEHVLVAENVPGINEHGVVAALADQPVLAKDCVRFFGEAVALVVGSAQAIDRLNLGDFPIRWEPQSPLLTIDDALAAQAPLIHAHRSENTLIRGRVSCGDPDGSFAHAAAVVEGEFETSFVEHAYLEPEAGWACMAGDTVEVYSPTQAPHPHRTELARVLGCTEDRVRVIPTAVGGGFGGKLDLSVQPLVAVAAWTLRKTVGMVFTREESIAASTKRHPARIRSRIAADTGGLLQAIDFYGTFNTGAYASWGSAVANRVPVHACGPYKVPHYRALTRAVHTHVTPAGAFRGFGVPQTAVAQEQLIDELANRLGIDRLEFRLRNVIRSGDTLVTGQSLADSVGIEACLKALQPRWHEAVAAAALANTDVHSPLRRGVGLAAMMYGCGNTAMSNPSTIRLGVTPDGDVVLHQGAVDAGQGSNTVIPQIAADALGIALHRLKCVGADTHLTPDCGRTSASRQTFVTGKAAQRTGERLRRDILARLALDPESRPRIEFIKGAIRAADATLDLSALAVNEFGYALMAEETFDPPSTALDENGQGSPYAVYAFGAQLAEVEVDTRTGATRVLRHTAAHDVGHAVNPALLEGQIEGAVAQGIGMALMERFIPGVTNNFHDYLVPTSLDMPSVIEIILVEDPAAIGPYGAKGIGEPSLVPTAAAVMNALADAIGSRIREIPATPEVVLRHLKVLRAGPPN
jgi:aldehyde oxidoreductase